MDYRIEKDSMGELEVPSNKYWGAQTQRSYNNFEIGIEKMPVEIIDSFAILKKACAITNNRLGILSEEKKDFIAKVSDEILEGKLDDNFPLVVWQTGSGTQSNMNINEVIANRGNELAEKNFCTQMMMSINLKVQMTPSLLPCILLELLLLKIILFPS